MLRAEVLSLLQKIAHGLGPLLVFLIHGMAGIEDRTHQRHGSFRLEVLRLVTQHRHGLRRNLRVPEQHRDFLGMRLSHLKAHLCGTGSVFRWVLHQGRQLSLFDQGLEVRHFDIRGVLEQLLKRPCAADVDSDSFEWIEVGDHRDGGNSNAQTFECAEGY